MVGSASEGQTFPKKIADKRREASARVTSEGTPRHMESRGVESIENCMNALRASERVKAVSPPAKSMPIEQALNQGCTTNINMNGLFLVNCFASLKEKSAFSLARQ